MKTAQDIIAILREKFSSPSVAVFTINALEALSHKDSRAALGITDEDYPAALEAMDELEKALRSRFLKK